LVQRISQTNPDKEIYFLDKDICYCSTMNRIDLPHLVWAMESLVSGKVVNQIRVAPEVARFSNSHWKECSLYSYAHAYLKRSILEKGATNA
jgi:quinolinate synthase